MPGHAKSYIVGSKFLPAGTFSRFLLVERSANDFAWAPISPKLFTKPFEQQMTVIVKNVCRIRLVRTSTSLCLPTPWDGRSHFQLEALRAWKALAEHSGEEGGGMGEQFKRATNQGEPACRTTHVQGFYNVTV